MTDEEALALKAGDEITDPDGALRVVCYVDDCRPSGVALYARRRGRRPDGRQWNRVRRYARDVTRVRSFDPATANVYADWLDERGEARAADLLRKAFPIDLGNG